MRNQIMDWINKKIQKDRNLEPNTFCCEVKFMKFLAHDFIKRGDVKFSEVYDLIIFFV